MSQLDELKLQFSSNAQVRAASQWYNALPGRDQTIVKVLGWLVVLSLVYLVVFAPLIKDNRAARADLADQLSTYNLIAENAGKFGGASQAAGASSGPILPKVSQAARNDGIKLDRYEQDGSDVRIWMDGIEFDRFISWTESLQARDGIRVSQITLDAAELPGRVDVRATLTPN